MATVTKLKAAVNNKNLPILGEDGNLYNYYFGRYFNKIVEKGYTLTSGEITALNAFIQDGINNGWIDIVKYFLPLIGDSSHLDAAAVPLIDEVGNYEMAEYDGTEDFSNSFEINSVNKKIKYYTRIVSGASLLKSPLTIESMNGGISFSGYIPTPEVFDDGNIHNDYYASIKRNDANELNFGVRYHESSTEKIHQLMYLANPSDTEMSYYRLDTPYKGLIEELNLQGKALIVNYALYKKENNEVWRLRNFVDADGNYNFTNYTPATPIEYPDYSANVLKMVFGQANPSSLTVPSQKFGCLGVLDAPNVTKSLVDSYNSAVFTLMAALGK